MGGPQSWLLTRCSGSHHSLRQYSLSSEGQCFISRRNPGKYQAAVKSLERERGVAETSQQPLATSCLPPPASRLPGQERLLAGPCLLLPYPHPWSSPCLPSTPGTSLVITSPSWWGPLKEPTALFSTWSAPPILPRVPGIHPGSSHSLAHAPPDISLVMCCKGDSYLPPQHPASPLLWCLSPEFGRSMARAKPTFPTSHLIYAFLIIH